MKRIAHFSRIAAGIVLFSSIFSIMMLTVALASAADTSHTVFEAGDQKGVDFKEGMPRVQRKGEGGGALKFDGPFNFRVDLKPKGVEPREFDLLKLTVKADRAAFMRVAVENHPRIGDISYWYVLDGMRGPFEWKTIWVDLNVPEEIKSGDDHRSPWREGMSENSAEQRGVRVLGHVRDLKSKSQGSQRNIWIEDIRFVRKAIHLDWDQTQAPYTWGSNTGSKDEDLVYTYPLTLTNKLDRPLTARLHLEPLDAEHAEATVDLPRVALDAGQTKEIEARVRLPAAVAAEQGPLYCERFLVTAEAKEVEDSRVTILRSSDPIHLTVTVPLDERHLEFPLFPRPSELPASVLRFDTELATQHANKDPQPLIDIAMRHGLYQYGSDADPHGVGQYRQTLISAAYLYDMTGQEQYLRTATQLLNALPAIWAKWYAEYQQQPVRIVSSGIVARWNDRSHYTLGLGWLVMGTQRSPYYYGTSGNGRGGSMGALAYAFDIVAQRLSEEERQKIIDGFFLPAAIQARNHYIGDGNQQMTADLTAMYGGILARNWPLVSFAYSSEHGFQSVLEESFDDDGVQLRKNYQTYTMRPVLWTSELLYGAGLDVYQKYGNRMSQIVHADTRAKQQGAPFEDTEFWQFVQQRRLK